MTDRPSSDPDPAATEIPVPSPRRGPVRRALLVVGIVAAVSVAGVGVRAVTRPAGGARSPEAAVAALAAAVADEDPLAAVGTLAPDEVEALEDVYTAAAARAEDLDLAPRSATLGGVDLDPDLTYEVEGLGPDAARVTIDGTVGLSGATATLGEATRAVLAREASLGGGAVGGEVEAELSDEDLTTIDDDGDAVAPFLVTVRREGRWYVSLLHTAAQYAVETLGLAPPTAVTTGADGGAPDPEGAVEALLVATAGSDATTTAGLVADGAGEVIERYRRAMEDLVGRVGADTSLTVDVLETEVEDREGGGVRVTVTRMEGTFTSTDDGDGDGDERLTSVVWDGTCATVTEIVAADRIGAPSTQHCLTDGWGRIGLDTLSVVVVEEAGGWRVDPLATVADHAETLAGGVTSDDVLRVLGLAATADPAAEVVVGRAVEVDLNQAGFAVVAIDVDEADDLAVSAHLDPAVDDELTTRLVGPDGERLTDLSLVEAPSAGRYLVVVARRGFGPGRVTVRVSPVDRRALVLGEVASDDVTGAADIVERDLDLDRGTDYELSLDGADLTASVLDPDGRRLPLDDLGGGRHTFTPRVDGLHTVQVDGGPGREQGRFRVEVDAVAPFVLGNGTSTEAEGDLLAADDGAQIDLTVRGGRATTVQLRPASATLDPVLVVEDPGSGEEVRRLDRSGPGQSETVTFTPEETTTYRIVVEGSHRSTGAFRLEATLVGSG